MADKHERQRRLEEHRETRRESIRVSMTPPGVYEYPMPEPGETWESYLAKLFQPVVPDGSDAVSYMLCKIGGCQVEPGWEATHYDRVHGFKGF